MDEEDQMAAMLAKEDQAKATYAAWGTLYGAFIKSLKAECGASERVAADVLIAHIEAYPARPK